MYKAGDKFIIEIEESYGADGFPQSGVWGVKGLSHLTVREETLNLLEKYAPSNTDYEKGLSDAWECMKKILDMTVSEQKEAFNILEFSADDVLGKLSPQEAIEKLKAWEEKQEIKVGDVVRVDSLVGDFVVTWRKEGMAHCMSLSKGTFCVRNCEKIVKTGKRIDLTEIFNTLEAI